MGLFGWGKKKKESEVKLISFPGDVQTLKAQLMAAEKGIQINVEMLALDKEACEQEHFRNMSPFCKYPILQQDDLTISGTPAVLAYLDVRGKTTGLNPKKAAFLGHQNYWGQLATKYGDPCVSTLVQETIYGPLLAQTYQQNNDRCQLANNQLQQLFDALDTQLRDKQFIIGQYSFADIHWTSIALLCDQLGLKSLINDRSNVKAWYQRVQSRASFSNLPTLDQLSQNQLKSVA